VRLVTGIGITIDNRIYNSRLNTSHQLRRRNVINFHRFSRDKKWRIRRKSGCYGGGIRHITATQAEVKEVPACVRKLCCFNALIFDNILSAFAKEYLIAARY